MPAGAGPHGVVVLVHGGGWEAGDRVTYIAPMLALAAAKGLAWVSIDYRLTPDVTNREQVTDVKTALAWRAQPRARNCAWIPRAWHWQANRPAGSWSRIWPRASRAWRASCRSTVSTTSKPMAGDPANPRSLARRLFRLTTLDDAGRETLRAYSPLHHASKTAPPMLLLAGTADRLVTQQRAYATALKSGRRARRRVRTRRRPARHGGVERRSRVARLGEGGRRLARRSTPVTTNGERGTANGQRVPALESGRPRWPARPPARDTGWETSDRADAWQRSGAAPGRTSRQPFPMKSSAAGVRRHAAAASGHRTSRTRRPMCVFSVGLPTPPLRTMPLPPQRRCSQWCPARLSPRCSGT